MLLLQIFSLILTQECRGGYVGGQAGVNRGD